MSTTSISVKSAIYSGIAMVRVPARRILALTSLSIPVVWLIWGFSWVTFLHFPIGIIVASVYSSRARAKWRLWAYAHVADIHQLQRSAELAELLHVGSHNSVRGWMNGNQRRELTKLLNRFGQDSGFIDDPEVPGETNVYGRRAGPGGEPVLVINDSGITVHGERSFSWDEIENERIANVGYVGRNRLWGNQGSAGTSKAFRFNSGSKQYEFHMADIQTDASELDLLMSIYRGRWMESRDSIM